MSQCNIQAFDSFDSLNSFDWPFGSLDDSDLFRGGLYENNYQLRMERIGQLVKCNIAFLENLE